jgi:hypothetical protein
MTPVTARDAQTPVPDERAGAGVSQKPGGNALGNPPPGGFWPAGPAWYSFRIHESGNFARKFEKQGPQAWKPPLLDTGRPRT